MGNQLRGVVLVPYALLDSLVDETMRHRKTVLILVRLIAIMTIASSLIYSLATASSGLSFNSSLHCYSSETPDLSRRRRFEHERGMGETRSRSSKVDRRFRRLEKTVESLSHGLILALIQLKSGNIHADTEPRRRGHDSGPGLRRPPSYSNAANDGDSSVDDGSYFNLSTTFMGMGLSENGTETLIFVFVAWATDHVYMHSARRG